MMEECQKLGIKYVKMQMWKPEQVPKEVRDMYIDERRATNFFLFAKDMGIELFFTCFYPEAVQICENIGVNFYKVRYNDRNNMILYRALKRTKKKIFVSCYSGKDTVYMNLYNYQKNIIFLRCDPNYPSKSIVPYIKEWGHHARLISGFSDHTKDLELLKTTDKNKQVEWFEVHVCLDRETAYEGAWSKTFEELKEVLT